jgi:diguanylate cyclase
VEARGRTIGLSAALEEGSDAPAVVRSIIHLAGTLGMTAVAEGIERATQVARLQSLGAQYGQGFYFAEPLSPEELTSYLGDDTGEAIQATG